MDVQGHVKPSDADMRITFVAVQGNIEVPLSFLSSCGFSGTWKCEPLSHLLRIYNCGTRIREAFCLRTVFVGFSNTKIGHH